MFLTAPQSMITAFSATIQTAKLVLMGIKSTELSVVCLVVYLTVFLANLILSVIVVKMGMLLLMT